MRPWHCPFHQPSSIISMLVMMSSGLKEISSSASVWRRRRKGFVLTSVERWLLNERSENEELKKCQTSFVVINCDRLLATRQVFIVVVCSCKRKHWSGWVFHMWKVWHLTDSRHRPVGTGGGGSARSSYSPPSSSSSTAADLWGSGGASESRKSSERGGKAGGSSYSGSYWKHHRISFRFHDEEKLNTRPRKKFKMCLVY